MESLGFQVSTTTFADGLFIGLIVGFILMCLGYYLGSERSGKVVDEGHHEGNAGEEPPDYPRYLQR